MGADEVGESNADEDGVSVPASRMGDCGGEGEGIVTREGGGGCLLLCQCVWMWVR